MADGTSLGSFLGEGVCYRLASAPVAGSRIVLAGASGHGGGVGPATLSSTSAANCVFLLFIGLACYSWWWLAAVAGCGLLVAQTRPLPPRFRTSALWLPGSEIVAPRWVWLAIRGSGAPWVEAFLGAAGALVPLVLWLILDVAGSPETATEALARWPDRRVDPRARVVDRVAPPAVFDFQDMDDGGDHIVAIGESPPRLIAYSVGGEVLSSFRLRPFWANNTGMAVEVATDTESGVSWFLAGPHTLGGARFRNGNWESMGETPPLPVNLLHGAMFWFPTRRKVGMVTLNVAETGDFPRYIEVNPDMTDPEIRVLRGPDKRPLPVIRDAVWIPSLRRIVLAPDFGDRLFLVDPSTGEGTPWLAVATLNGRMIWDDVSQRLYVAQPERAEVVVIDPVLDKVERRIFTERGVHAIAVDGRRGLLFAGSVLSGAVQEYRLADGARMDSWKGCMPMVRNLLVLPDRGELFLSTWSVLYRIPYRSEAETPLLPTSFGH